MSYSNEFGRFAYVTFIDEGADGAEAAASNSEYRCRILGKSDNRLILTAPFSQGSAVWPNTGTQARVAPGGSNGKPGSTGIQAVVSGRRLKPFPLLVVESKADEVFPDRSIDTDRGHLSRIIAVTSGKGGTGKTTVSISLAHRFSEQDVRVAVIDTDLGTANVAVSLGIQVERTIADLLDGEAELDDVITETETGFDLLPGGSGILSIAELSPWKFGRLISALSELEDRYDVIILDTGAGIGPDVSNFLLTADEILIVANTEPTAIVDAYAVMKTISNHDGGVRVSFLFNRVEKEDLAEKLADNVLSASERFLGTGALYLGTLPEDPRVRQALGNRESVITVFPRTPFVQALNRLSGHLIPGDRETGAQTPEMPARTLIERLKAVVSWQ